MQKRKHPGRNAYEEMLGNQCQFLEPWCTKLELDVDLGPGIRAVRERRTIWRVKMVWGGSRSQAAGRMPGKADNGDLLMLFSASNSD
jgi:hypothetical protein